MHTLECFEELTGFANQLGYEIRHEWLGGTGGGVCEFAGGKWIFLDLALNTAEQLDQLCEALCDCPEIHSVELPGAIRRLLELETANWSENEQASNQTRRAA